MENTAWKENLYLNKATKCLQSVDGKTCHTTACFLCYFFAIIIWMLGLNYALSLLMTTSRPQNTAPRVEFIIFLSVFLHKIRDLNHFC